MQVEVLGFRACLVDRVDNRGAHGGGPEARKMRVFSAGLRETEWLRR